MNRNYSGPQLAYMTAAAAFDVVARQVNCTDDAYCAAFQAKIDAQKALFSWCRSLVASDPKTARKFAANRAELDHLFDNVWKFPTIREKLTDACLRLEAPAPRKSRLQQLIDAGASSAEIGEESRRMMFGENGEAFPDEAEWSRIVD